MARKFRVRLESPDMKKAKGKPHFRVTSLVADDEAHARQMCEQREAEIVAHTYPDDVVRGLRQVVADAKAAGHDVPGEVRGKLVAHRQNRPYDIVSVEEVG